MKKFFAVMFVFLATALLPATTRAEAEVFNTPDGLGCAWGIIGEFLAFGDRTIIKSANGRISGHCQAELTSGTPPETALFFDEVLFFSPFGPIFGDVVVTPSGLVLIYFYDIP